MKDFGDLIRTYIVQVYHCYCMYTLFRLIWGLRRQKWLSDVKTAFKLKCVQLFVLMILCIQVCYWKEWRNTMYIDKWIFQILSLLRWSICMMLCQKCYSINTQKHMYICVRYVINCLVNPCLTDTLPWRHL